MAVVPVGLNATTPAAPVTPVPAAPTVNPDQPAPTPSATPPDAEPVEPAPAQELPVDAPPGPVREIRLVANTASQFSLGWTPPSGEPATHYRVRVNSGAWMQVATPTVTLGFPPDGSSARVEITAVDAQGDRGEWRSIVVLPPSIPTPTPTPTPEPTVTVEPVALPEPVVPGL
ncbi:MAG: fibronectin type III domain-containing protein [Micropruina sp.]|nr:fibronectin type III domain-containing protein [Micropruina sp.]